MAQYPVPDGPAQYKRFLDMAREVEADEDPEALDRAFKKIVALPIGKTAPTQITEDVATKLILAAPEGQSKS